MSKKIFTPIVLLLALLSLTSCSIDLGDIQPNLEDSVLLGSWQTAVNYRSSDSLYDYGTVTWIDVSSDGVLTVNIAPMLKQRNSNVWTRDLSKAITENRYGVRDIPYSDGTGYASITDYETYKSIRVEYSRTPSVLVVKFPQADLESKPETLIFTRVQTKPSAPVKN